MGDAAEVLARINYLVGTVSQRRMRFEGADAAGGGAEGQPHVYSKARYLLGVVLADPRFQAPRWRRWTRGARRAFNVALSGTEPQVELRATQHLALIGLGRLPPAGRIRGGVRGVRAGCLAPATGTRPSSRTALRALQNEDFGGSLGSLKRCMRRSSRGPSARIVDPQSTSITTRASTTR